MGLLDSTPAGAGPANACRRSDVHPPALSPARTGSPCAVWVVGLEIGAAGLLGLPMRRAVNAAQARRRGDVQYCSGSWPSVPPIELKSSFNRDWSEMIPNAVPLLLYTQQ